MSLPEAAASTSRTRAFAGLRRPDYRRLEWIVLLGIVLVALLSGLPHLHESLWQDEASTLEFHASKGVLHPFLHYSSPNNHILFSAMLAAWLELLPSPDVALLRLLPLGLFALAVPVVFAAARRLGGRLAAAIAALLFASSSVAGNFATQLRGYAPSWLFVALALLCAMHMLAQRRRWLWQSGYCLSALVAVWIIPTNVFLAEASAASVSIWLLLDPVNRSRNGLRAVAILLLAPALGLLVAYAPVWDELMLGASLVESPWTRAGLLRNWWHGTLSDYRWFLPIAFVALLLTAVHVLRRKAPLELQAQRALLLALMLLLAPALAVVLMPRAPFPRTLVPYLPVWYCAIACLVSRLLLQFTGGALPALGLAALASCGLLLANTSPTPSCRAERGTGGAYDYDLCHQYFRDAYYPEQVLDAWASLDRPDVPIATNFEGYYSLRALGSRATIFEFRFPPRSGVAPLIVAHDATEMRVMTQSLGLDPAPYGLLADTGWFKVYAPVRRR